MGYRIKTVSEMTGVPRNTLLAWERRYGLARPARLPNGYRSYSDRDVAIIRQAKALVDQGYQISEAISMISPPEPPGATDGGSLAAEGRALEQDLLAFERDAALGRVRRLGTRSYDALVRDLYLPVLRRIGDRWESGEASVAQEHFASQFVRDRLTEMLGQLDHGPGDGPRALLACIPGERHDLPLMGLGVRLALRGWRVVFLGADVPSDALEHALEEVVPAMVALSVIRPGDREVLEEVARRARAAAPDPTRVVLGGSGLPEPPPEVEGVELYREAEALL